MPLKLLRTRKAIPKHFLADSKEEKAEKELVHSGGEKRKESAEGRSRKRPRKEKKKAKKCDSAEPSSIHPDLLAQTPLVRPCANGRLRKTFL